MFQKSNPMKTTFFTLAALLLLGTLQTNAQCAVGDGLPTYSAITINGDMADWAPVLADADNNTYDGSPDGDGVISDIGRDFVRMAYTQNAANLYLYLQRAGSSNNQVAVIVYMDINYNQKMETNEPVITVNWNGMNRLGSIHIYDYVQAVAGGDDITDDGVDMPGLLSGFARESIAANIMIGAADGYSVELAVPLARINKRGSVNPLDQLAFGESFNFHVASLNGSVATVGQPNAINDNWRKCNLAMTVLPVAPQKTARPAAGPDNGPARLRLLNNPVTTRIDFTYQAATAGLLTINLYNSTGSLLCSRRVSCTEGLNRFSTGQGFLRARDIYLLEVIDGRNQPVTTRAVHL